MTDTGLPPSPDSSEPGSTSSASEPRPRVGAGTFGDSGDATTGTTTTGTTTTDTTTTDTTTTDTTTDTTDSAEKPAPVVVHKPGINQQLRTLIEWVGVAVGALAVALLIKAFLLQAYYIPSASMDPTLHEDDRVLVNKLSYRLGDIQRGDVVVFARPEGAPGDIDDFIKRVIALPGETVSFSDGDVFIDGINLTEDYVAADTSNSFVIPGCTNTPAVADTCQVPEGMLFVMGDNRGASWDSRRFGPITEDSVVGRAFLKVWPPTDIGFL